MSNLREKLERSRGPRQRSARKDYIYFSSKSTVLEAVCGDLMETGKLDPKDAAVSLGKIDRMGKILGIGHHNHRTLTSQMSAREVRSVTEMNLVGVLSDEAISNIADLIISMREGANG